MKLQFRNPSATIFMSAIMLVNCIACKLPENSILNHTTMENEYNPNLMHRTIDAWIDIDARPEEVWDVLVDFKSWESWNAFIPFVEGNLQAGERMHIKVVPPGLNPMIFNPEIYAVIPNKKILWGGSFLKFIYRGDHAFLLETAPNGKTRFRQIERFRGPMVLFMGDMIKKTETGYHQMNLALKEHVERNTKK